VLKMYTMGDVYPVSDITNIIQFIDHARYISLFDAFGN